MNRQAPPGELSPDSCDRAPRSWHALTDEPAFVARVPNFGRCAPAVAGTVEGGRVPSPVGDPTVPAPVTPQTPVAGERRLVRVWFGDHVIAKYRAEPALADRYAQAMSRRFAGLRVTNDPIPTPAGVVSVPGSPSLTSSDGGDPAELPTSELLWPLTVQ